MSGSNITRLAVLLLVTSSVIPAVANADPGDSTVRLEWSATTGSGPSGPDVLQTTAEIGDTLYLDLWFDYDASEEVFPYAFLVTLGFYSVYGLIAMPTVEVCPNPPNPAGPIACAGTSEIDPDNTFNVTHEDAFPGYFFFAELVDPFLGPATSPGSTHLARFVVDACAAGFTQVFVTNAQGVFSSGTFPSPGPSASIDLIVSAGNPNSVPFATKTTSLSYDADVDGYADAGDSIRHLIDLTNSGAAVATDVVVNDPDTSDTTLIAGTVSISQGTVVEGNAFGDADVIVDIGSVSPGTTATVMYDVTVDTPIPGSVHSTAGQAIVTSPGCGFAGVSDDPTTTVVGDSTLVALGDSDGSYIDAFSRIGETSGYLTQPGTPGGDPGGVLSAFDYFGRPEGIGDFDMDGIPDVVIGTGTTDLYILALNADGTVKQRWDLLEGTIPGPVDEDFFGVEIAALGDLDGVGGSRLALAIGSIYDDGLGLDRGAVYIVFINDDGTVASQTKIGDGGSGGLPMGTLADSDFFGRSVTHLGDIDGVGGAETAIAIGASAEDSGGAAAGAVYITLLNADGTVFGTPVLISEGLGGFTGPIKENSSAEFFGSSVASLGDIDSDGSIELAIGENRDDVGGTDAGAIWIVSLDASGSTTGTEVKLDGSHPLLMTLATAGVRLGSKIRRIADIDGDDVPEILGSLDGESFVVLLLNSDKTLKAVRTFTSEEGGVPSFGTMTGTNGGSEIGDLDGDGVNEWIVGVPDIAEFSGLTDDRGIAYVLFPTTVPEPGLGAGLVSGLMLLIAFGRRARNQAW